MKVEQFKHANQFLLTDDDGNRFLQSYNTIVCKVDKTGKVYLDPKHNFSNTTSKHVTMFLGDNTKERLAKIKSGEYTLTNLN